MPVAIVSRPSLALNRDPTRTTGLRKEYAAQMNKRFRNLAGHIREAIVGRDILNLSGSTPPTVMAHIPGHVTRTTVAGEIVEIPRRFTFATDEEKLNGFMSWLNRTADAEILEISRGPGQTTITGRTEWQNTYVRSAYARGVIHADAKLKEAGVEVSEQSLQNTFNQPIHADKLAVLYGRNFRELEGITQAMSTAISRALAEGLGTGLSPRDMASRIATEIAISRKRAVTLARTEVIRAHAESTLNRYQQAGLTEVVGAAEFITSQDNRVCPICLSLEAKVFTLQEARGIIPVHPNCRCAWLPVAGKPQAVSSPAAAPSLTNFQKMVRDLNSKHPEGDFDDVRRTQWKKFFFEEHKDNPEFETLNQSVTWYQMDEDVSGDIRRILDEWMSGEEIVGESKKRLEAGRSMMRAIANSDPDSPTLYRGTAIPESEDVVRSMFRPGSTMDRPIVSFSRDQNVARNFIDNTHGNIQDVLGPTDTTKVMFQLEDGAHHLDFQPFALSDNVFKEAESLTGGRFEVLDVTDFGEGDVLLVKLRQVDVFDGGSPITKVPQPPGPTPTIVTTPDSDTIDDVVRALNSISDEGTGVKLGKAGTAGIQGAKMSFKDVKAWMKNLKEQYKGDKEFAALFRAAREYQEGDTEATRTLRAMGLEL